MFSANVGSSASGISWSSNIFHNTVSVPSGFRTNVAGVIPPPTTSRIGTSAASFSLADLTDSNIMLSASGLAVGEEFAGPYIKVVYRPGNSVPTRFEVTFASGFGGIVTRTLTVLTGITEALTGSRTFYIRYRATGYSQPARMVRSVIASDSVILFLLDDSVDYLNDNTFLRANIGFDYVTSGGSNSPMEISADQTSGSGDFPFYPPLSSSTLAPASFFCSSFSILDLSYQF